MPTLHIEGSSEKKHFSASPPPRFTRRDALFSALGHVESHCAGIIFVSPGLRLIQAVPCDASSRSKKRCERDIVAGNFIIICNSVQLDLHHVIMIKYLIVIGNQ